MFKFGTIRRAPLLGVATTMLIVIAQAVVARDLPTQPSEPTLHAARLATPSPPTVHAGADVSGPALGAPEISPFGLPCTPVLHVAATGDGLLRVALVAPCRLNQLVTLHHAALDLSARLSNTGALDLSLPSLRADGAVRVSFADGGELTARSPVDGLATLRRVVLVHDAPGADVVLATSGPDRWVKRHYEATASGEMAVLTAAGTDGTVRLALRLSVTPASCGRPFTARLIEQGVGSEVQKTHLSVNLPGCDHVGEVLELKNIVPDLKLSRN